MLELRAVSAGYHGGTVLDRVDLTVEAGQVHALLGHNGAGKTTLLKVAAGLLRSSSGQLLLDGTDLTVRPAFRIARAGIRLVPQGRRVFGSLTVAEHLTLAGRGEGWTRERLLGVLPALGRLLDRRGRQLSGGEQQMLAIARALSGNPKVLLLDEPTEGLAPRIAEEVLALVPALAAEGLAVLLAAPRPAAVAGIADRASVLAGGRIAATAEAGADLASLLPLLTPKGTG